MLSQCHRRAFLPDLAWSHFGPDCPLLMETTLHFFDDSFDILAGVTRTLHPLCASLILILFCSCGDSAGSDADNGQMCEADIECAGGEICFGGLCTEGCFSSQDCSAAAVCDTSAGVCVESQCIGDNDCVGGQACVDSLCVPLDGGQLCEPGTRRCDSGAIMTCSGDGLSETRSTCGLLQICVSPQEGFASCEDEEPGDIQTNCPLEGFPRVGRYSLSLTTVLNPQQPIGFDLEVTSSSGGDVLGFTLQPLVSEFDQDGNERADSGNPVGAEWQTVTSRSDACEFTTTEVEVIPGLANTISGSDMRLLMGFEIIYVENTGFVGTASLDVSSPVAGVFQGEFVAVAQ